MVAVGRRGGRTREEDCACVGRVHICLTDLVFQPAWAAKETTSAVG